MATSRQRLLSGLIAIVVVHKAAYFFEYAVLPFLYGPIFDSAVYDAQAAAVRAGQFGDATLLAFSPLYGYFLAAFPTGEFLFVVVAQLAMGLLNLVIVHRIALRLFGAREALASAAIYFGYGVFSFYETKVLSETLGMTLALLATLQFMSEPVRERGDAKRSLLSGVLMALAVLARASLLFAGLFSVIVAFLPWGEARESAKVCGKRGIGHGAGFALILLLNGSWNYMHTGFFVPVIFVSHTATAAANVGERWSGDLSQLSPNTSGEVSPWDVVDQANDRLHRRSATPATASQLNVGGILRGAPDKILRTLSDQETTFDYGFYGERSEVTALYLLPLSFGCLLLLGAVGAFFLARRHGVRALLPFLPLIVGTLATTVLFHPSSRYRLPMALPLVLLAGFGILRAVEIEATRVRRAVCVTLLVACLALITRHEFRPLQSPAWWQVRVAEAAAASGDLATLEARVRRARAMAPHDARLQRRLDQISHLPR